MVMMNSTLSRAITLAVILSMVLVVFTGIPTNVSAKKGSSAQPVETEIAGFPVVILWKNSGYEISLSSSEDLLVFLIVIDEKGELSYQEMKYEDGFYVGWVSKYTTMPLSDIYIAICDASDHLNPFEEGIWKALEFDILRLDISGKNGNVQVTVEPVVDFELHLEVIFEGPSLASHYRGGNANVDFTSLKRSTGVHGSGVDSFFDIEYILTLETSDPDFQVDSFFDVFFDITFDPSGGSQGKNGSGPNSFFDIDYGLDSDHFIIDSFFDVSYRHSNEGNEFFVDSFFDIDYSVELPSPGLPPGEFLIDSFFDIHTEVDSFLPSPGHTKPEFMFAPFSQVVTEAKLDLPSPGHTTDPTIPQDSFFGYRVLAEVDLPAVTGPYNKQPVRSRFILRYSS
jgi:hypothetical protein